MEIVSFEIAKKLKEKGFPQHITDEAYIVDNYGEDECDIGDRLPIPLIPDYMDDVAAPTISQVLKWLRDKEVYVVPTFCVDQNDNGYWDFRIIDLIDGTLIYDEIKNRYNTYEQAAIAGVEYVINNLI